MLPTKATIKESLAAVPKHTWKVLGGALLFGLIMRLATTLGHKD